MEDFLFSKTDISIYEILNFISKGGVAVVAGFQGISTEKRITTLGRGGSDLSAVAIAKKVNYVGEISEMDLWKHEIKEEELIGSYDWVLAFYDDDEIFLYW